MRMQKQEKRELSRFTFHFSLFTSPVGFTLLEVLVSVALLAIAVTVVFQLFSANLRAVVASEDYVMAAARANAAMRDVLDDDKLDEKSWSEKTADGYGVSVNISEALKERTENLQVKVLEIVLTVSWTKGTKERAITLHTLKTVNKQV